MTKRDPIPEPTGEVLDDELPLHDDDPDVEED